MSSGQAPISASFILRLSSRRDVLGCVVLAGSRFQCFSKLLPFGLAYFFSALIGASNFPDEGWLGAENV